MVSVNKRVILHQTFISSVLVLLFISACDWLADEPDWSKIRVDLEENREKWDSYSPANYQYILDYAYPIGPYPNIPIRIAVKNGTVETVTFLWRYGREPETYTLEELKGSDDPEGGYGASLKDIRDQDWEYPTIEDLFHLIQNAIDIEAEEIEVKYDPEYGYPIRANIDYWVRADDDEDSFDAHSLAFAEQNE